MDKLNAQYQEDFSRHVEALMELEDHTGLDVRQRQAVAHAARVLRILASNPTPAQAIVDILHQQDRRQSTLRTRAQTQIIWGRIDKTVHQSARDTFNLGRVSSAMLDAATALASIASAHRSRLDPGQEAAEAMDALEAASHPLRAAAKALSGSTPSAIRVDHDGLEKILSQWEPIRSVEDLLNRFEALGIAWEDPAPAISLCPAHSRC